MTNKTTRPVGAAFAEGSSKGMQMGNVKYAIVAGVVAGLAVPTISGTAFAQTGGAWNPTVFNVNNPDPEDKARVRQYPGPDGVEDTADDQLRLRKTDEEFTQEMGVVKFFGASNKGVYVEMRTGALPDGSKPPQGTRMQGACTPIQLTQGADGKIGMEKLPGEKFISDNDGNEYRNFNKPELMPINGGENMLVMFNYQPDNGNDTKRYAKVLDSNCNELPITNAAGETRKQVLIMAKNNDDCDMHQSGEGPCDIASDANGTTHLTCWAGCNGNGRDDGWLNDVTVNCTGAGAAASCQITKNFDISLARREERSRGRCSTSASDPNTAICSWTEGNNQPQRDGTWLAAVNIGAGENGADVQSRLLWKEQIEGRKETEITLANGEVANRRTYSSRAMHSRMLMPNAAGELVKSDMLFYRMGDLRGRNRNNEKGGSYRAFQVAVIKATAAGMEYVMPITNVTDALLGIDGTHLTMCNAVFGSGTNLMPGFTLLQGSHNGGGAGEPIVKAIGFDMATKKLVDMGTHRAGGSYDRHMYSNYLGNNPGNQGRNFAGCALTKNPFAGQNGNTTQYFIAHAMTGKSPEYVRDASMKGSSYVTMLPIASTIGAARSGLEAEESQDDTVGCTAVNGQAAGESALLLVACLGLIIVRRRRA